jgi:hypothetical protein
MLDLDEKQRMLFLTNMLTIIMQLFFAYCLMESKDKFEVKKCSMYIIFTGLSYYFYYKLLLD